jgi:hypothetical protein
LTIAYPSAAFKRPVGLSREVASGRQLSKTLPIHADATAKLTKYKTYHDEISLAPPSF